MTVIMTQPGMASHSRSTPGGGGEAGGGEAVR